MWNLCQIQQRTRVHATPRRHRSSLQSLALFESNTKRRKNNTPIQSEKQLHSNMFSKRSLMWMAASCVVPVGFYIGLSARESNDDEIKEKKRIDILINERLEKRKEDQRQQQQQQQQQEKDSANE
jgi:hypothetical protein